MARPLTILDAPAVDAVRRAARHERARVLLDEAMVGIFGPIRYVEASGRARCRSCGRTIPRGERCVVFKLDLYIKRFGKWGNAVDAYLHVTCPPTEQEERGVS